MMNLGSNPALLKFHMSCHVLLRMLPGSSRYKTVEQRLRVCETLLYAGLG